LLVQRRIVGDEVGGSGRVELGHLLRDLGRVPLLGPDEGGERDSTDR
jgi:hypothetical protein